MKIAFFVKLTSSIFIISEKKGSVPRIDAFSKKLRISNDDKATANPKCGSTLSFYESRGSWRRFLRTLGKA
jgi:hypothetical protein